MLRACWKAGSAAIVEALEENRQAGQHLLKEAGALTGLHHHRVQGGEDFLMPGHRLVQRFAISDLVVNLAQHVGQPFVDGGLDE